jgi:hypothetical protein
MRSHRDDTERRIAAATWRSRKRGRYHCFRRWTAGSDLIWSLLQRGIAAHDARGGIKVDFGTGALISSTGVIDRNIRALGLVTCGSYFYVDSLDMISRQARHADLSPSWLAATLWR